jgi:RNA polymerase sigma factor (sigma-70 family)
MEEKELTPEELYYTYEHYVPQTLNKIYYDVRGICNQYRIQYEDLLQYGRLGLWKGCLSFNKSKSQFNTHAINNIKWAVYTALRRDCNIIKYSTKMKYDKDHIYNIISTDQFIGGEGEGQTYHDVIASDYDLFDEVKDSVDKESILSIATEREKEIIKYKYEGKSQNQIGKLLGISGQRVGQMWKQYLEKLKDTRKVELV